MKWLDRWVHKRFMESLKNVKEKEQLLCQHDYHILQEYQSFKNFTVLDKIDLFCPKCEKILSDIYAPTAEIILKKCEILKKYNSK